MIKSEKEERKKCTERKRKKEKAHDACLHRDQNNTHTLMCQMSCCSAAKHAGMSGISLICHLNSSTHAS